MEDAPGQSQISLSKISLSKLLLEQSPACQWVVSADGVFQAIYGDASAVFGKSGSELQGRAVYHALDREAAGTWRGRFGRALKGETLALRHRHGLTSWNITVYPVHVDGKIRYAGGLARESTAWSTAERELRRTVVAALKTQDFE